jgi:taurine dioxygenase
VGGHGVRFSWEPLVGDFGAVVDMDLTAPIQQHTRQELLGLFDERELLVFRKQDITLEEQIGLVTCFYPLLDDPPVPALSTVAPGIGRYMTNVPTERNARSGELQFHTEFEFLDPPIYGLSLWAESAPDEGAAATLFLSSFTALKSFPHQLRHRVSGRQALHFRHGNYTGRGYDYPEIPADSIVSVAPLMSRHPRTGDPTLHFSPLYTHRVLGMSTEESTYLLRDLERALFEFGARYRHPWHRHDLIVWDNTKVLHAREDVKLDGRPRRLRRVPVGDPQRYADYKIRLANDVTD